MNVLRPLRGKPPSARSAIRFLGSMAVVVGCAGCNLIWSLGESDRLSPTAEGPGPATVTGGGGTSDMPVSGLGGAAGAAGATGAAGPAGPAGPAGAAGGGAGSGGAGGGGAGSAGGGSEMRPGNCGNGALDPGEQCDVNSEVNFGDCSSTCQVMGDPGTCLGSPPEFFIKPSYDLFVRGSTVGASPDTAGSSCTSIQAGAHHYSILPMATGTAVFTVEGDYNVAFAVRNHCGYLEHEYACASGGGVVGSSSMEVTYGQTVYLLVTADVNANSEGTYIMTIRYQ